MVMVVMLLPHDHRSFSFDNARFPTNWITVTDGRGTFLQEIEFQFTYVDSIILSVKAIPRCQTIAISRLPSPSPSPCRSITIAISRCFHHHCHHPLFPSSHRHLHFPSMANVDSPHKGRKPDFIWMHYVWRSHKKVDASSGLFLCLSVSVTITIISAISTARTWFTLTRAGDTSIARGKQKRIRGGDGDGDGDPIFRFERLHGVSM